MGFGCSICLMGSLVLITKWAPSNFSVLAGTILGIGGIGGLLATTPLSMLADTYGWRSAFWISAIVISIIALLYFIIIRDDPKVVDDGEEEIMKDSLNILKIIRQRDFKFMVPMSLMSYSSFVVVLGLWGASYLKDILSHVESDKVIIKLKTPISAALFYPVSQSENSNLTMLLMPIRLND